AERSRSLPWTEEQENAARAAYLAGRLATGAYPRLAAGIAGSAGAVDMEAMFERMLGRVLDGFDPGSSPRSVTRGQSSASWPSGPSSCVSSTEAGRRAADGTGRTPAARSADRPTGSGNGASVNAARAGPSSASRVSTVISSSSCDVQLCGQAAG